MRVLAKWYFIIEFNLVHDGFGDAITDAVPATSLGQNVSVPEQVLMRRFGRVAAGRIVNAIITNARTTADNTMMQNAVSIYRL